MPTADELIEDMRRYARHWQQGTTLFDADARERCRVRVWLLECMIAIYESGGLMMDAEGRRADTTT